MPDGSGRATTDTDGDGVPDILENELGMSSAVQNTFGNFKGSPRSKLKRDNEWYAWAGAALAADFDGIYRPSTGGVTFPYQGELPVKADVKRDFSVFGKKWFEPSPAFAPTPPPP